MHIAGIAVVVVLGMIAIGALLDILRLVGLRILEIPLLLAIFGVAVIAIARSRNARKVASAPTGYQAYSSGTQQQNAPPPPNTYDVNEASPAPPKPKRTIVASDYIQLELDLDTNMMTGLILKGAYASYKLEHQPVSVLIDVWREVAAVDPEGRQLLESYLEKTHPTWREAAASSNQGKNEDQGGSSYSMSKKDAYEILGLNAGASVEEIKAAHKAAIKRNHPDTGGSNRLAALINEAKKALLSRN